MFIQPVDIQPKDLQPNDLDAYWMPYTANRAFKYRPRLLVGAREYARLSHNVRVPR